MKITKKVGLASTIALACSLAGPAFAQSVPEASEGASPESGEEIIVTGSRIARQRTEGPAPVTTIGATEIDSNGFRSVFEALTTISQNTGSVQGEDFGSTFTPAANVINLRGLGPNHSLVLVNGNRVADYPVAYNGSVNAVNLANIPQAFVESIEILSGSAGAVYGSDAIAGVVNIRLKEEVGGLHVNLRGGSTQQGGGDNYRGQFIGGQRFGRLSVVLGGEISRRDPIWWDDRKIANSYSRHSSEDLPQIPPALFAVTNPSSRRYYDPDPGVCEGLSHLQEGSIERVVHPTRGGSYCGSDKYYNFRTIQTEKDAANFYGRLSLGIDDDTTLYATGLYSQTTIRNVVRSLTWSSTFFNRATNRLEAWSRVLTPEETGGRFGISSGYDETAWNGTIGIRGALGAGWTYEASYNRSEYESDQTRVRLLAGIDAFFRGERQGTESGYAAYNAPLSRLFAPLTPEEFGALSATAITRTKTKLQDVSLSVSGSVFDLPAGPVQVAAVIEGGDNSFSNIPDPRINEGAFWNVAQAQPSEGDRRRQAAGIEARVPLFSWLTATGAGRYDRYKYAGNTIDAATWAAGIELRPTRTILVRGSWSTSFRAPDMNYVFQTLTRGYYPGVTDFYQCRLDGQPYSSCTTSYNMDFSQTGSRDLEPERGRSFTVGAIWSPSPRFDISVDYYNILIKDQVTSLSEDQLLRQEADCRIGQSVSGSPVDINSALCRDALARIERNPANAAVDPNKVILIHNNPINAAREKTDGIDVNANLRWSVDDIGKFTLNAKYTRVLSHGFRQFAGDPKVDYLKDLAYQTDWRDRANATLTFETGPVGLTLLGTRYGKIPKNDYSASRDPYTVFNGSIRYDASARASVSLIVNNLFDAYPKDRSGGWPYYSIGYYDIYGRQFWVQASYRFGGDS